MSSWTQRFPMTTNELCAFYKTSRNTLLRLRKEEILQPGIHYIRKGLGSNKPSLLWNPAAVEDTLAKRSKRAQK